MTGAAAIALALALVAAVIDWRAVVRNDLDVESFAKPLVMVALVMTTLLAEIDWALRAPLLAALFLSLLGDVVLLPSVDRFLTGLGAFLAAHIAYGVAFVRLEITWAATIVAFIVTSLVGVAVLRQFRGGPHLAVVLYVSVLVGMAALAVGTGEAIVIAGALLFVASDATLGWNRFATPLRHGRLITHVLYHVGQALIVVGVATA